jgi:hypothetical protein
VFVRCEAFTRIKCAEIRQLAIIAVTNDSIGRTGLLFNCFGVYGLPRRVQCSIVPTYRKAAQDQQQQQSRQEDAKTSPSPENINPNQQVPDKSAAERERQRLREQERRRREAVSEVSFILWKELGVSVWNVESLFPERE